MSKNSYAEQMNNSKTMIAGLKQHTERLSKRGLDGEFLTNIETNYTEAQTLDNEQEKLKAELKTKTETLKLKVKDLSKMYAEARKIIKIEMEQSSWKEFGINDKR